MSKKSIMYPYDGKGICHYGYAQIGGIKQYVQIRGSDRRSPVLLVIHGGPGSSLAGICHVMQDRWEQMLVVANYDQRGTSKTLMANPGREAEIGQTGSLEDHLSDVDGVIDYLHRFLDFEKVFILGFSWGSIVGAEYARRHPEKVRGYIAVGQIVNFRRGIDLTCRELFDAVRKNGSARELKLIEKSRRSIPKKPEMNDEFLKGLLNALKIANKYLAPHGKPFPFVRYMLSPLMNFREELSMFSTDTSKLAGTYRTLLAYDLAECGDFPVPVCFVYGEEDVCCRTALMKECYDRIGAPLKKLVIIKKATHMCFYDEPEKFADIMMRFIDEIMKS